MNIKQKVWQMSGEIVRWRRELHQIPELGLHVPRTSAYIQRELEQMGIPYKTLLNGHAVVGWIEGKTPGKTLAIRADMDGLPLTEETGLPYRSVTGHMHACGHDGHMAILLGAAKILREHKDLLAGNVKLLFQPGEEYPGGAKPMIEEGALEDPRVDAVIGLHAGNISAKIGERERGHIGVAYGRMMASMDRIQIRIKGKGAHGAYPENAIDPISTAAEVISALQRIVSREIRPQEPAVLSITRIEGGFNQNIIPGEVVMEGTVRTFDHRVRAFMATRIEEITKGVCEAMRADYEIVNDRKYPPLVTDPEFTEFFVKSAKKILKEEEILTITEPLMGAEDFSFFLEQVPGTYFFLSTPGVIDGKVYPHHHPKFDLSEGELYIGTALFVQTAMDFLQ